MSIYLASRGVESIGMNKGGRVEAAGIGLNMVHAEHTGGITVTAGGARGDPRGRLLGLAASSSRTGRASTTPATRPSSATWRW